MRKQSLLFGMLGLLALGLIAGCSSEKKGADGDGLRSVQVPNDFTFATSRSVALELSVSPSLTANGPVAVEVTTPDKKVLFRGSVASGSPLSLKLPVPSKDGALQATLFVNNEPKTADISIENGSAKYLFQ